MTRYLLPLAFLLLAVLSGCSSRSPETLAIRAGSKAQLYRENSCHAGAVAVLESYGSGWYVRERRPGMDHAWAWLGVEPGTPGTYYLADGRDMWGTAGSIEQVRRRHGYTAGQAIITRYRIPGDSRPIYPIHHIGAFR